MESGITTRLLENLDSSDLTEIPSLPSTSLDRLVEIFAVCLCFKHVRKLKLVCKFCLTQTLFSQNSLCDLCIHALLS